MITIKVKYLSPAGRVEQRGSFHIRGRKPETIALEWIKKIKKEVYFEELLEVIVDGKEDITEKVLEMQKAPLD
ncbi:hypothetical protein LC048_13510 [Mesobacillus subterraneus]|uniref:hypothetical protein n=1 Tax=Mesobacillus subterraneus TaxID=285983 RepID=UPI001CFD89F9|nr:hypothetical protein [Mesobacillus subterraneus]WLR53540.1 hypothetical protein LC048_13510 [Mesobacillus subterraneus]